MRACSLLALEPAHRAEQPVQAPPQQLLVEARGFQIGSVACCFHGGRFSRSSPFDHCRAGTQRDVNKCEELSIAQQATLDRAGVIPADAGQLEFLLTDDPTPPAQLLDQVGRNLIGRHPVVFEPV